MEDIGLQPTPLSWSLYGIIREFIPWPSDIVGSQAIWPPCLATTTATLYTPQHATMHQLAGCGAHTQTRTHVTRALLPGLWGWCVSSGSPNIIPDVRFCCRPISGAQHHSIPHYLPSMSSSLLSDADLAELSTCCWRPMVTDIQFQIWAF